MYTLLRDAVIHRTEPFLLEPNLHVEARHAPERNVTMNDGQCVDV